MYIVIRNLMGGIGQLVKQFNSEEQAEEYANNSIEDLEVLEITKKEFDQILNNNGYLE